MPSFPFEPALALELLLGSGTNTQVDRDGLTWCPVGARRISMKRLIVLALLLATLGIGIGTTVAAVEPPRVPPVGTEGPDER